MKPNNYDLKEVRHWAAKGYCVSHVTLLHGSSKSTPTVLLYTMEKREQLEVPKPEFDVVKVEKDGTVTRFCDVISCGKRGTEIVGFNRYCHAHAAMENHAYEKAMRAPKPDTGLEPPSEATEPAPDIGQLLKARHRIAILRQRSIDDTPRLKGKASVRENTHRINALRDAIEEINALIGESEPPSKVAEAPPDDYNARHAFYNKTVWDHLSQSEPIPPSPLTNSKEASLLSQVGLKLAKERINSYWERALIDRQFNSPSKDDATNVGYANGLHTAILIIDDLLKDDQS